MWFDVSIQNCMSQRIRYDFGAIYLPVDCTFSVVDFVLSSAVSISAVINRISFILWPSFSGVIFLLQPVRWQFFEDTLWWSLPPHLHTCFALVSGLLRLPFFLAGGSPVDRLHFLIVSLLNSSVLPPSPPPFWLRPRSFLFGLWAGVATSRSSSQNTSVRTLFCAGSYLTWVAWTASGALEERDMW